jgi:hypothetical protein
MSSKSKLCVLIGDCLWWQHKMREGNNICYIYLDLTSWTNDEMDWSETYYLWEVNTQWMWQRSPHLCPLIRFSFNQPIIVFQMGPTDFSAILTYFRFIKSSATTDKNSKTAHIHIHHLFACSNLPQYDHESDYVLLFGNIKFASKLQLCLKLPVWLFLYF